MITMKKWLRKRVSRTKDTSSLRSPMPFLPTERSSYLTPSASSDDLTSYISNYGHFGRLPPEIRREILIFAFGARTIHVDLTYDSPFIREDKAAPVPRKGLSSTKTSIKTTPMTHYGISSELVTNSILPPCWQWFSCVCHRLPTWPEHYLLEGSSFSPSDDRCLMGTFCSCVGQDKSQKKREHLDSCYIGVMGWLLVCRMAYTDGIDVLFATNTFHISNLDLLEHLPDLLLRQRLARITSLELLWNFSKWNKTSSRHINLLLPLWENPEKKNFPLHTLCRLVPDIFPHVRHLYISLQSHIAPPKDKGFHKPLVEIERVVMGPIEDMIRVLGLGRQVTIAIQRGGWNMLLKRNWELHGDDLTVEMENRSTGRFWKALNPNGDLGYWISTGWDDMGFDYSYEAAKFWGDAADKIPGWTVPIYFARKAGFADGWQLDKPQ